MGVNSPVSSKQSNLTIDEILDGASKSANTGGIENAVHTSEVRIGKTWEIAIADFFISNARTDNWGWADPRNVMFLDTWREFEPNAKFLLLYGSVAQFLATEISGQPEGQISIEERVEYWIAYQRKLLDFYHRNRDVTTLLHLDSLAGAADQAADAVSAKLGVQLNRLNEHAELELSKLTDIAAAHLVSRVEGHVGIYEELEGSSDSPLDAPSIDNADYTDSVLRELREFAKLEQELDNSSKRNSDLELRLEQTVQQLEQTVQQLDESKRNAIDLAASLDREKKEATTSELVAEVDALQSQLAQTQSELEHYFSKYQEIRTSDSVLPTPKEEIPVTTASEVSIDFRSFVDATGMYYPEPQGRWAGPLVQSDISLKDLKPAGYDICLRVVDAMSTDLLYGARLLFNGREISSGVTIFADTGGRLAPLRRLKARIQGHQKPFPAEIRAQITPDLFEKQQLSQVLSIVSPGVATPASSGGEDTRKLSICLQSLVLKVRQ